MTAIESHGYDLGLDHGRIADLYRALFRLLHRDRAEWLAAAAAVLTTAVTGR